MFFNFSEARYRVECWSLVETLGGMVGALCFFPLKCLDLAYLTE